MATPTNSEIEFALSMHDDATATFRKFAGETQRGAEDVRGSLDAMGRTAERGRGNVGGLTEAMREGRMENRRNRFIISELNDGMDSIDRTMRSAGLGSRGLTSAFHSLGKTAAVSIGTFDGLGAVLGPMGLGGPIALAATGAVALGVAIAEMTKEAEESAVKIRLTADAVKALDDAYTEYSSKFQHGGRNRREVEAQKKVAEQDLKAFQRMANNMSLFARSFTGESVRITDAAGNVSQWSGENLRKALAGVMPDVDKLWKEFLAVSGKDEDKAQEMFAEHMQKVRDKMAAARDVATRGVIKDEEAKQEAVKRTYEKMKALETTYINDAQKKRYDEMVQFAETIRLFMKQNADTRQQLVAENNAAWIKAQMGALKGVTNASFAAFDAKLLEIDDGWKVFISSVNAGVDSLAGSIQEGFARGWEEAFGEANSVLEKFLNSMYSQTMAMLARIMAQKFILGLFDLFGGAGSVIRAASGGDVGAGSGSNDKFSPRRISAIQSASPAPVVVVNIRGALSGQRFLQDEMPTYNRFVVAKTV